MLLLLIKLLILIRVSVELLNRTLHDVVRDDNRQKENKQRKHYFEKSVWYVGV